MPTQEVITTLPPEAVKALPLEFVILAVILGLIIGAALCQVGSGGEDCFK